MFDFMKSNGESSCREREDGDDATGSERPLKKARFAWQVKGKYHLKNETDESNKNLPSTEPSTSKPSPPSIGLSSTLNKVENYLTEQDFNKFESVINSDDSFLTSMSNLKTELQHYPRYVSTYERACYNNVLSNCNNNKQTVSMPNTAENQCIAQWQAKQIGKSCLDNTLNEVLESWINNPLQAEENNPRFIGLDFAEFINHLPGDNSVENEGILMAISAHGLQNTPSSSSDDACSITSVQACNSPSPLRCISPVVSDDDSESTNKKQNETESKTSSGIQNRHSDNQHSNHSTPFAYFSEPSQSPYHLFDDYDQNSNNDYVDIDSHFDFMNTAVLYAIKSKGLTASCTEYG